MIRFFCTKCKLVKRVRVMPVFVENMSAGRPEDRIGECAWHANGSRPRGPARVRINKRKSSPAPEPQAKPKQQRGKRTAA